MEPSTFYLFHCGTPIYRISKLCVQCFQRRIDAAQTDGNCTYDAPTARTFTFASPVRLAEYQGMGGEEGAFWIDTIQINP